MAKPLRVLIVEDAPDDAELLLRELRRQGYDPVAERVETRAAMQAALGAGPWDVILSDNSLPQYGAEAALQVLQEVGLDVPFIVVSGSIGEDAAVALMKAGAHDYLFKGNLARLGTAVERELREAEERRKRRQAEEALRRSEEQFRQAQKMEAVGRLAGGIAHDFNNLLTVITSYSDILLEDLAPQDPRCQDVEEIRKAAASGAGLTRQLLAFSRQQVLQPRVLDVNAVLANAEKLLKRLLGEDIELVTTLTPQLGAVKADPGQLEQVIMNLAVNARDAMPDGGKLTIETANADMDEASVRVHPYAKPGQYVMLAVSDTGSGMDEQTKARIFEPFFTTKEAGKGTGLGLATVYGIVKQSGGFIWVYSEPSHGTTFKIYLPRVDEPVEGLSVPSSSAESLRGAETVLLAEDAAAVRTVARQVLERHGYTVLEAPNGEAALYLATKHHGPIHLLLTDVVMPGLGGRQLADQLRALRPELKVLYASGYTDDAVVRHGVLKPGIAYLQKPLTPEALARKVREVLNSPRAT